MEETGDDSIMCLTETQKKVDDIKIVKDLKIIQTMREMQDRKEGGLLILYKEKEKYDLSEDDNEKHRNTACRRRNRKRIN